MIPTAFNTDRYGELKVGKGGRDSKASGRRSAPRPDCNAQQYTLPATFRYMLNLSP